MGKLIVIEGLDGSGKATQAGLLTQSLLRQGRQVMQVSFPNYQSQASGPIKMYLSGAFGTDAQSVNAYAASTFYAVDRFASYAQTWKDFYQSGGIVVADRYTTSNFIHQATKLPQNQWQPYVHWLEDLEYEKMGIPRPAKVLYLYVQPQISQQLMNKRYGGDESKKDIHESNVAYLQQCQAAAAWCVQTQGWQQVNCSPNGAMRPPEEIAAEIAALIQEDL